MSERVCESNEDRVSFAEWAGTSRGERLARVEYLQNPPEFSDLWVKRELLSRALKPLAAKSRGDQVDIKKSKGANMEVYDFVPEDFCALLRGWISQRYSVDEALEEKIAQFTSYVAGRFVFKVGNTDDYIINFSGRTEVLPRDHLEQGFGPLGYPIKNRRQRVEKLAREVSRINLYLGSEDLSPVTGPCICDEIRRFLEDPMNYVFSETSEFFVSDDSCPEAPRKGMKVEELYAESSDTSFQYSEYLTLNREFRRETDIKSFEDDLEPFCDALITVGWHSTIRRLLGYNKHTTRSYKQVRAVLEQLSGKYEDEVFIFPEQTTYGYDPRVSSSEWREKIDQNDAAVRRFSYCLSSVIDGLPGKIKTVFAGEDVLLEFSHRLMEHYHEVPDYEVDSATSVISSTMLKFLVKAFYLYVFKPGSQKRRDFGKDPYLKAFFDAFDPMTRRVLLFAVTAALLKYEALEKLEGYKGYSRIEKTQVKTQDKLNRCDESEELLEETPISIAKLMNERQDLLHTYPELAEKLVVYFYQLYKFCRYTGYVPDMRPDNVVKYVFGLGEWAMETSNTQIVIFKGADGEVRTKIVNIDPEDQFRMTPKRGELRDPREGLATYGMNMGLVAERSIKKAMLRFLDGVCDHRGIVGEKTRWNLARRATQLVEDFFRESGDMMTESAEFVADSVVDEIGAQTRLNLSLWRRAIQFLMSNS